MSFDPAAIGRPGEARRYAVTGEAIAA